MSTDVLGERPIRAMHGYHPDAPHSFASLLTNYTDVPAHITAIPHVYELMTTQAEQAHRANRAVAAPAQSIASQAHL